MVSTKIFAGKKVTLLGLGLLGRGVGDAAFLARQGASLIVTDLKSREALAPSIKKLRRFKNITFVLGRHRLKDFRNRDFILKSAGVPLDSSFVAEAKQNKIPVYMSTALFAKLAEERRVKIIGVTGTRGKSTVTQLIYEILRKDHRRVFLGGNVRGVSTLALLPKVRNGDMAVLELDSWQLQGFGDLKISPTVAVFTNFMPDHLDYYRGDIKKYLADKANIYKHQSPGNILIWGDKVKARIPKDWKINLLGAHNRRNIAIAMAVAERLGVPMGIIRETVEKFAGVPGRLDLVREVGGVRYFNDTTATMPAAAIAALKSFNHKVIWIGGGQDKKLDVEELVGALSSRAKIIILLPGSGSEKLKGANQKLKVVEMASLKEAVAEAKRVSQSGDVVLFSPGFSSFNLFKNEFDRGEQFVRLVKKIK